MIEGKVKGFLRFFWILMEISILFVSLYSRQISEVKVLKGRNGDVVSIERKLLTFLP